MIWYPYALCLDVLGLRLYGRPEVFVIAESSLSGPSKASLRPDLLIVHTVLLLVLVFQGSRQCSRVQ